ncbi:hypothetical protein SEA_JOIEB_76 [Mycobacterium phage JoieB]|uniref:DUF1376 domain-containing protein n=1 Tax=Mycobacterium phage JoieB TaxID=2653277 RepID=A0A5P8D594_9CAUD|nr:hypothetical protein SEA_JOIEB_76 [Mycobacterium phage JoieB]
MGWVRLSDDFYDNGKLSEVNPLCISLYLAAIAWCNRNLSDGQIPRSRIQGLLDFDGIAINVEPGTVVPEEPSGLVFDLIEMLVQAGLIHESGHDCDGQYCRGIDPGNRRYLIHDYLQFQPSKKDVEEKRVANAKRVAEWRERRKKPDGNAVTSDITNDVRNDVSNGPVTTPPNPTPNPSISTHQSSSLTLVEGSGETPAKAGAATAKKKSRGSRLPEGWVPSDETINAMLDELGCDKQELVREHRSFTDYWLAAPGQKGVKLDWDATWRNWMRRAASGGNIRSRAPLVQAAAQPPRRRNNDDKINELLNMEL